MPGQFPNARVSTGPATPERTDCRRTWTTWEGTLKPESEQDRQRAKSLEAARTLRCETCARRVAGFESVHYGSMGSGYRDLCNRCFNEEVARVGRIEFSHVQFEPLDMSDAAGVVHRFHFEVRLLGDRVALEAFELVDDGPGGYRFQVLGHAGDDLFDLMAQMVSRMRKSLARQHLKTSVDFGLHIADFVVRGQISSDLENESGRVPVLVIDGREISWEKFGHMLMSFEGWQFKLEIRDRSEEV